jgi:hypothetical protein
VFYGGVDNMFTKKNIIMGTISILIIAIFCTSFVIYQTKINPKTNWSIMISEEGAFIEGRKDIPFKYTYINEKNKIYKN